MIMLKCIYLLFNILDGIQDNAFLSFYKNLPNVSFYADIIYIRLTLILCQLLRFYGLFIFRLFY